MSGFQTSQEPNKVRGVRISVLNVVIIFITAILSIILMFYAQENNFAYDALEQASNRYVECEEASNQLKEASAYLTLQARTFAATQDPMYLDRYFTEATVNWRREKSVQVLAEYLPEGDSRRHLDLALEYSKELVEQEMYVMKLVVEAKDITLNDNTAALADITLTPADAALSSDDKIKRAMSLVYNEDYASQAALIERHVMLCQHRLLEDYEVERQEISAYIHWLLYYQQILTWVMFAAVIALILSFLYFVIWPMRRYITKLSAGARLPMTGAYELRFLARAYNLMYDENSKSRKELKREAEHDPLTGLYNRGVFERQLEGLHDENIALILIDIDYFKTVNDTLGHDGGDAVLKKVAGQLTKYFRSSDYACRIGGDEFAVVLTNIDESLKQVVETKVVCVREGMMNTEDGLPEITISAGIAFSEPNLTSEGLFKHADSALYLVKESGRNGYRFYVDPLA